jgi:antitoxin PrlF
MDTVAASAMTSKGRITVPKEIRDRLRLRPGGQVEFQIDGLGQVIMRRRKIDVRELRGIV